MISTRLWLGCWLRSSSSEPVVTISPASRIPILVQRGGGQARALFQARGEFVDEVPPPVVELDQLEQITDQPGAPVHRDLVARGEEVQVLPHLHVVIDAKEVRHVSDQTPDSARILADRVTRHPGVAAARSQQRRQHANSAGLAGSVWADETEQIPLVDRQVQVFDRSQLAIGLAQIADFHEGAHGSRTRVKAESSKLTTTPPSAWTRRRISASGPT